MSVTDKPQTRFWTTHVGNTRTIWGVEKVTPEADL